MTKGGDDAPMAPDDSSGAFSRLRPWQRFHVRLIGPNAAFALLLVAALTWHVYHRDVKAEHASLQMRLKVAAAAIATAIPAEAMHELRTPDDKAKPVYGTLMARFARIAEVDQGITSIYVFRPGEAPNRLVFVADFFRGGVAPGEPGAPYDASRTPHMMEGLERPSVEEKVYTDDWGTVLSGYAPIFDAEGRSLGLVGVDVSAASIEENTRLVRRDGILMFLLATVALCVLSAFVARSVRVPLQRILHATSAVARGRFNVRAATARSDEFGIVGRFVDKMARGLRERDIIRRTFDAYVSPGVRRRVLSGGRGVIAGRRRQVAVLFVDVRKFTALAESLAPEELVNLLNDYLHRMSRVVTRNGGRIDKFIGDAIMADWGSLDDHAEPAASAADTAVEMVRILAEFNQERAARGAPPIRIGIGVHFGEVVAGSIGSGRKLEFTVIGDAVNVASRLEGLTKLYGATIVASRELVEAAGQGRPARRLDRVLVEGREAVSEIYELLQPDDPRVQRIAAYERGIDLFRAGALAAAITAFEEAAVGLDDPPTRFQVDRCREQIANPPPASWDGVLRRAK